MKLVDRLNERDIKKSELDRIEVLLDKLFSAIGMDVEFTKHFHDRLNDPRNGKPITLDELSKLYIEVFRAYGKKISSLPDEAEAVMKDMASDVNVPFVLDYNKKSGLIEMIAKTVMRKKDFKSKTKFYKVGRKNEMKLAERIYTLLNEENKLNVDNVPLDKARAYAEEQFKKAGKELDDVIPDFDSNYKKLQKRMDFASLIKIDRIDMPVIEPKDIKKFEDDIKAGKIDIFKPAAHGDIAFPKDLVTNREAAKDFLTLGLKDGNEKDDRIKAKMTTMAANKLKPIQDEIWLEKLVEMIAKFGPPLAGSPVASATIIVSKEGYILDGHHRFGQAMLANPTLKLKALVIPMDIDTLIKMGRSYGNAIGNKQKQ